MSSQAELITAPGRPFAAEAGIGWAAFRLIERAASILVLCACLPLLLLIGILVSVLSRRSPLIAHRRVGLHGEPFWLLKFRTMWSAGGDFPQRSRLIERIADEHGPGQKSIEDARVTSAFARLLRRSSFDELPQLVHVLSGRMSLVGPRPLTRRELELHYGARAQDVLRVKPGLTGLWQVMGRNRLTYRQRRRLDLFYVGHRCPALYAMILARTIPQVIAGRDSW